MKGDTEVILMVVFFFAGALFMAYAEELSVFSYLDTVLGAISTLAAAYFGAKYAYKLQLASIEQKTSKEQVEAGNKAIFELIRVFNQFNVIKRQFINEFRHDPARHFSLRPLLGNLRPMQLDYDALAFLFETEDRNLLGQLAVFQQEVATCMDVIDQRSRLHMEHVQPVVEKIEKESGGKISLPQIEGAIGTRKTHTIKELTDFMVSSVDGVVERADSYTKDLQKAIKRKFPEHTVIGMAAPLADDATRS